MKKKTAIFILSLFIIGLTSCRTREKCPAYGYHSTVNHKSNNG